MEIAAYQLLERLAQKAGDTDTAEVARQNRSDEEQMARRIDQSWDRTLNSPWRRTASGSERHVPLRTQRGGIR
jgi:ferritin-like metal-binding protein YciE